MRGIYISNLSQSKYKGRLGNLFKACGLDVLSSEDYVGPTDHDYVVVFGVAGKTKRIMDDYRTAGKGVVYCDKGYLGGGRHFKVSPGGFQPLRTLIEGTYPSDRWRPLARLRRVSFDVPLPDVSRKGPVFLVAYSAKYAMFQGLEDPTTYWSRVVEDLVKLGYERDQIIYRPKPTWEAAVPIDGTQYAHEGERLGYVLREMYEGRMSLLVTHGSNGALTGVFAGIPCITLGQGAMSPVAVAHSLTRSWNIVSHSFMQQWAYNLAYCQYTEEEVRKGTARAFIEAELLRLKDTC